MTSNEIQKIADSKRESAVKGLNEMFGICEPFTSETVSQIVRDIMDAVILEISSINAESIELQLYLKTTEP